MDVIEMLSEPRITKIRQLKSYYLDEDFIRNFEYEWNAARKVVIDSMDRYEKLYQSNKDFKNYVDSYMKNKNMTLSQVLSLKIVHIVADMYEKESGTNEKETTPNTL